MKKVILFLLISISAVGQIMPAYFPAFESNRPKGNKYLYYRLYSTSRLLIQHPLQSLNLTLQHRLILNLQDMSLCRVLRAI
jgi:hypothetical protein